jgi:hypothetical protein
MIGTIKGGRYTTEVRKRFFGDYSFVFNSIMLNMHHFAKTGAGAT